MENGDKEEGGLMLPGSGNAITSNLDMFSHSDTTYQSTRNEKYTIFRNALHSSKPNDGLYCYRRLANTVRNFKCHEQDFVVDKEVNRQLVQIWSNVLWLPFPFEDTGCCTLNKLKVP